MQNTNSEVGSTEDATRRWGKAYSEGRSEWHLEQVNPVLLKHMHELVHGTEPSALKIFYPLCGKSVDLKYFYRCGYRVFGIEFVKETVETLMKRDHLDLRFNSTESLFSTPDGRLNIFCGNFFECPIEKWGPFDVVWDRTGICSIPWDSVDDYVSMIRRSVQGRSFRYLLQVFDYKKKPGRALKRQRLEKELACIPYTKKELCDLFEDFASVRFLSSSRIGEDEFPELMSIVSADYDVEEANYLLTPKGSSKECKDEEVTANFELLPIQKWFFTLELSERDYWNQSFMAKVPVLNVERLRATLPKLEEFHEILRLRFQTNGEYQYIIPPNTSREPLLYVHDISRLPSPEGSSEFKQELHELLVTCQSGFNIVDGPTYSLTYLHGFADGTARLFYALHHLIVDSVSWTILLEDTEDLYSGLESGSRTTSYKEWIYTVQQYAKENEAQKQYWENIMRDFKHLPILDAKLAADPHNRFTIDKETTKIILRDSKLIFGMEINDILLTALGIALSKYSKSTVNHVTLEGHGRQDIRKDIDLSRTVGWFTSMYPMRLEVTEDIGESIRITSESRRQLPEKGFGYGALYGYVTEDMPLVVFNYIGQSYVNKDKDSWSIVQEENFYLHASLSLKNKMYNIMSVNGAAVDDGFQFTFSCPYDFGELVGAQFALACEGIASYLIEKSNQCK